MTQIRLGTPGDAARERELWQLAFGDDGAYVDNFYQTYYKPERMLLLEEDGVVQSMTAWFDTQLVLPGEGRFRAAYLYAVATDPAARGRGLAGRLLAGADEYFRGLAIPAVTTVPAEPSLHNFFGANGFRECFTLFQEDLDPGELPAPAWDNPLRPVSPAEYGAVREKILADCDCVVERTYHTKANQQAMMETFRSYTYMDHFGRLNIVSSTQVPFHVRRILGRALGIGASKVRVIKPRIGGGFGAKQTLVSEVYPAIVTVKTGKPAKMIFSRYESQICSSPRHEMELKVRIGADREGTIRAIDVYTLSNTGAFGEHGPTTVGLSGHKSIALYRNTEAYRFVYDVVYTNQMSAGAYRGYGATQGIFAVESAVNELAEKLHMDPVVLREKNMTKEGGRFIGYDGGTEVTSCALDRCMARAKEMFHWDEKFPRRVMENGKVRGVGVAMAMQGSSIAGVDVGGASVKLNEDGSYTLSLGATDMGTGCDTVLSQMAADTLMTDYDNIVVFGVDTDISPYDSGSYASATTYIAGKAVVKACESLKERIWDLGAGMLEVPREETDFDGSRVSRKDGSGAVSLEEIGIRGTFGNNDSLQVTENASSPISPPPFMVGMAEVEVDRETGSVEMIDYVAVVDCGTPINPNLARVQTEGGIAQGIGMALFEDIQYSERGQMLNNSLMQYKIPTRLDVGKIRVDFESSFEGSHPFGAKSIGEIVIDTPCPAIAAAVYNAAGVRVSEMPITPEKVAMGIAGIECENCKKDEF